MVCVLAGGTIVHGSCLVSSDVPRPVLATAARTACCLTGAAGLVPSFCVKGGLVATAMTGANGVAGGAVVGAHHRSLIPAAAFVGPPSVTGQLLLANTTETLPGAVSTSCVVGHRGVAAAILEAAKVGSAFVVVAAQRIVSTVDTTIVGMAGINRAS